MKNILKRTKDYAKKTIKKIDTKKIKKIIDNIPEKSTTEFISNRMKIQIDDKYLYDKVSRNDRFVAKRMKKNGARISRLLINN